MQCVNTRNDWKKIWRFVWREQRQEGGQEKGKTKENEGRRRGLEREGRGRERKEMRGQKGSEREALQKDTKTGYEIEQYSGAGRGEVKKMRKFFGSINKIINPNQSDLIKCQGFETIISA